MKRFLGLMLIGLILTMSIPAFATGSNVKPVVDVGLVYGSNHQFPLGLNSDSGFVFGVSEKENFQALLDLSAYKKVIVYKDGYYDAALKTLVTAMEAYYLNGQVKGAYHLQLGEIATSYDAVMPLYLSVIGAYPEAYLVYDDGWRVFYGSWVSEGEALAKVSEVQSKLVGIKVQTAPVNAMRVLLGSNDKIIFSYDTSETGTALKTSIFEYNAIKYRGIAIIKRLPNSDFTLINRVTMNEYLYGVLPKEMNGEWPIEALKAQAVASKNYVLTVGSKHQAYGFDVTATTSDQVYGGYSAEKPGSNRAVDAINGFALSSGGKVIPLYFHSHSGGITDNSENVWSATLPYIKSVVDPYSYGYPNTDWNVTMMRSEIEARLIVGGYSIGTLKSLHIVERAESGRVTKMTFEGTLSSATLAKDKIRSVLGSTVIKSLLFSFDASTAVTSPPTVQNNQSAAPSATVPVASAANEGLPVALRGSAGVYGTFVGGSQIQITEAGTVKTVNVDRDALRRATDIYVEAGASSGTYTKPYLYNPTESFDMSAGSVVFYGHGYGHGLGMSQYGAKKMAELGFTYEEILSFYYKDTQLIEY